MTKDDDDFSAEMAKTGVKPLIKRQGKVAIKPAIESLNLSLRRQAAASELPVGNHPDHYAGIEWLGPHDVVEYKRQGLKPDTFKNLKQGRYDIEAQLDLHRYRVEEAKIALFQFVKDCLEQGLRCAIVTHGKGWHGNPHQEAPDMQTSKAVSRIKSYTVHWLKGMTLVQALSSAQARDGGTGALYVLLQKSDKTKESDRRKQRSDDKY